MENHLKERTLALAIWRGIKAVLLQAPGIIVPKNPWAEGNVVGKYPQSTLCLL